MDTTWWTAADQIDNDQRALIEIAVNSGHVLVTGPPGSGKTNVLLLRASYLGKAGEKNCAVLVFTRELREFIVAGTNRPNMVPAARIQTHAKWTWDLLGKLGRPLKPFKGGVGHDEARQLRHQALERAVQELRLPNDYFDSILLDEVQDYLACEVSFFPNLPSGCLWWAIANSASTTKTKDCELQRKLDARNTGSSSTTGWEGRYAPLRIDCVPARIRSRWNKIVSMTNGRVLPGWRCIGRRILRHS